MPITFYPHEDDLDTSSVTDKLDVLLDSAEKYKSLVLEATTPGSAINENGNKRRVTPKDLTFVFNWQEIAKVLRLIREMPEGTAANKTAKADHLTKLAEIYEVLRGAKMAKLEAVRLALMNEANQLRSSASQVA